MTLGGGNCRKGVKKREGRSLRPCDEIHRIALLKSVHVLGRQSLSDPKEGVEKQARKKERRDAEQWKSGMSLGKRLRGWW